MVWLLSIIFSNYFTRSTVETTGQIADKNNNLFTNAGFKIEFPSVINIKFSLKV